MDNLNDYERALIFGIMLAAPIGPMALLTIRKTLCSGRLCGLMTGLGAATGDALYAMISFLGITSITSFMSAHKFYIQLCGALLIFLFSTYLLFKGKISDIDLSGGVHQETEDQRYRQYFKLFLLSVGLAIANPPTISIFIAGSSMLNIIPGSILKSYILTLIVWGASFLWYIGLVYFISFIREKLNLSLINTINLASIAFLLIISTKILYGLF